MAERLVFIDHQEQLKITIGTTKQEFTKREKVNLSLNVSDKDNKPVLGSFSLSIIDETKVPYDETNETSILSNLLLTSDLRGYIQQPNYYFTNVDEQKIRHLDMLMLTQGWRRFVWKNILNDADPPLSYQPEQGLVISGRVTASGKPVINGKVLLLYKNGSPVLRDTLTDSQGKFRFNSLFFTDSIKAVIQAQNAKGSKFVNIEVDQPIPQRVTKNKNLANLELNINKNLIGYLKNSVQQFDSLKRMASSSIMLNEVAIVEKNR